MHDTDQLIHELTEAFLRWPLPESVCADLCATKQGPGRIGTNLLSYTEARAMLDAVVHTAIASLVAQRDREIAMHSNTVAQRDEAEEAVDKLASAVLKEPIDWHDHGAKWAEALDKVESENARIAAIAEKMKKFVADNYPADANGQVDFARALVEGYAKELLGQDS
jgi:hypothetical protein